MKVWLTTACGWEKPVCSPGADSGLRFPNGPETPELWTATRHHLRRLTSHQRGEKGREKLLQEFPVYILQVSRLDQPVARLIGAGLLDAWPVRLRLRLSECPASVQGFRVLVPVEELRRLPAADVGGGLARSLLRGGARPAHEPLTFPGTVTSA